MSWLLSAFRRRGATVEPSAGAHDCNHADHQHPVSEAGEAGSAPDDSRKKGRARVGTRTWGSSRFLANTRAMPWWMRMRQRCRGSPWSRRGRRPTSRGSSRTLTPTWTGHPHIVTRRSSAAARGYRAARIRRTSTDAAGRTRTARRKFASPTLAASAVRTAGPACSRTAPIKARCFSRCRTRRRASAASGRVKSTCSTRHNPGAAKDRRRPSAATRSCFARRRRKRSGRTYTAGSTRSERTQ